MYENSLILFIWLLNQYYRHLFHIHDMSAVKPGHTEGFCSNEMIFYLICTQSFFFLQRAENIVQLPLAVDTIWNRMDSLNEHNSRPTDGWNAVIIVIAWRTVFTVSSLALRQIRVSCCALEWRRGTMGRELESRQICSPYPGSAACECWHTQIAVLIICHSTLEAQ